MVQQSLIEYIQRLLNQGYGEGVIRQTLLNAGYLPSEVDIALRVSKGSAGVKQVPVKMLVWVFVGLVVISGLVLVLLRVMQPVPAELSFSLGLLSAVVAPWQDVVVTAEVFNPQGAFVSGLIDFVVSGPQGKVISRTESFSVRTQTKVPVVFSVKDLPQGLYKIDAVLSYGTVVRRASVSFQVVETQVAASVESLSELSVERASVLTSACPRNCDDADFCTVDSCVSGACVHTSISPCCGNGVCDSGESVQSCVVDCGEHVAIETRIAQAVSQSASNPQGSVAACAALGQQAYVDSCLRQVAKASKNKGACEGVVESAQKDACLMSFALDGDFSVCDLVMDSSLRASCYSLKQLSEMKKS